MRIVTELGFDADLTPDQEKALMEAVGQAILAVDFGQVLGAGIELKAKDQRIEAPRTSQELEQLFRQGETIAAAQDKRGHPGIGVVIRKLIAKAREQGQDLDDVRKWYAELEEELEQVRKAGWLAWCGWINKKSDFAKRMEALRDLCEGDE